MLALGLALAALIGLSLGLLGGGGSILTVPVLVYVLGFAAKPALAMSLPVVGITSLVSAGMHWRLGNVQVATALTFGLVAMVGAFAGAKLAVFLSGEVQLALLALVMLVAAGSMLLGTDSTQDNNGTNGTDGRNGASGLGEVQAGPLRRLALLIPIALAVGMLTGLIGIGGGFLVVPALVLVARLPMRQAVGTSLLVITMNSASGFAGYLGTVDLDWAFLAGFASAAVAGALVGTALVPRVPQVALKRGFAVLLLVMGAFVLYQNRDAFSMPRARTTASASSSITAPATAAGVAR